MEITEKDLLIFRALKVYNGSYPGSDKDHMRWGRDNDIISPQEWADGKKKLYDLTTEQIKELAEKAGFSHNDITIDCDKFRKFAELIAKDCYVMIHNVQQERNHYSPYDKNRSEIERYTYQIEKALLYHFKGFGKISWDES